jgi:hypothetical protein
MALPVGALNLNFIVVQTNSPMTMTILDNSTYPTNPPVVTSPTMVITVPGFEKKSTVFTPNGYNTYDSTTLGLTELHKEVPLPDGIYTMRYFVTPEDATFVEHAIMRVDRLQAKFDEAFMTLDMMECDMAIKTQSFVQLNTIYLFIQGSIAAANNCASVEANKLYNQASRLLDIFLRSGCGCTGNNYVVNLKY